MPGNLQAHVRREFVFLTLAVMDAGVIAPLYVAFLAPLVDATPWAMLAVVLVVILGIHYLARSSFSLPMDPGFKYAIIAASITLTALLAIHRVLYPEAPLLASGWLRSVYRSLRQNLFTSDLLVFTLAAVLWWRGFSLAQRRLDSGSVGFRFRLGVVLLAMTTGIAGPMFPWTYHHVVFLFFFASLLGIALARAEEVGQQYGGRQTPLSLGWLTAMIVVSGVVLGLAAGLTSVLTGETLGRVLLPVLGVLQVVVFVIVYALAWIARLVIEPLLFLLCRYEIGRALADVLDNFSFQDFSSEQDGPMAPAFTPEQLGTMRVITAVLGAVIVLFLVAISLYRLRARAGGPSDEKRESVWEGVQLRRGLEGLLKGGQRRLGKLGDALSRSRLGHAFAALTIRRIYAHMASLAARRGYPRAIDETPYDYLPTLKTAFPESQEEVTSITESYVAVHYGELPERRDELHSVQSAWQQIQDRPSKPPRERKRDMPGSWP